MLPSSAAAPQLPAITLLDGPGADEIGLDPVDGLSAAALELVRSATEAEVVVAVRAATRDLIPGRRIRFASATPGGWHLLLDEQAGEDAAVRFPLRAGGNLLGELAILGTEPVGSAEAALVAELAAHTALAMARLEYGRLLTTLSPAPDPDVFAANSFRDPVTNLASRMLFHDRVEHALHRRSRQVHPVAVMVIDLAGSISAVREGMGAAAGDRLMVQLAKRLQRLVRSADTLARLHDDQLGALLDDLDSAADATLVAERLLAAVAEPFVVSAGLPLSLQANIGIAVNCGAAESAVELLQKAGAAAASARRQGIGFDTNPGRPRVGLASNRVRR